ncbi:hypothetical protein ACFSY7_14715 [Kurthia populi]|uniref:SMODS and SLOG-associating 2TM effector domain-containing protein n=1 Tax=Kurthia populi TaxID=1562132 RepID=A0ABW5Y344_9BACL
MTSNNSIKDELDRILHKIAAQEDLEKEFEKGSFYKWEELRRNWFRNSEKYLKVKNILFLAQTLLGIVPAILTIFVDEINNKGVELSIWIAYAIIVILINYLYKNFPDEYEKALKDLKLIKLVSMSEKLASQLALLNLTTNKRFNEDDENRINQISSRVKDFDAMDEEVQRIIMKCAQKNYRAHEVRATSLVFKYEDIYLTNEEKISLNKITHEICDVAQILFGGKGYTAKLYLRVVKDIPTHTDNQQQTEILTAFSRFPAKDTFGTSWIKSRGKGAKVWDCIEKGESNIYSFQEENLYYKSILSVCLPGQIGVLNIQSENENNFEDIDVEINSKVISLYATELIEKTLELD